MNGEVELHAGVVVTETDPVGFGIMDNTDAMAVNEWLHSDQEDLLGVNDATMFYNDFPPLPDFPCMSSSSSSSSSSPSAPPTKTITCSSSSSSSSSGSSSWAVLKEDMEKRKNNNSHCYIINQHDAVEEAAAPPQLALSSTASMEISQPMDLTPSGVDVGIGDCMDVMEPFGFIDLLENNDFFDPESIFQNNIENPLLEEVTQEQKPQQVEQQQHEVVAQHQPPTQQEPEEGGTNNNNTTNKEGEIQGEGGPDDEMSNVFLEWLKSNKDTVSASDLRSVKLKKATIECAARRLGGGKEGMKRLLKLILEWVQTSHLKNKNTPSNNVPSLNHNMNPSSLGPESNPCFSQSPWISPPPYGADPGAMVQYPQPMVGFVGDPYTNGASNCVNGTHNTAYPAGTEYDMLESANSWPNSQFTIASHYNQPFGDNTFQPAGAGPPAYAGYGNQHPYQFFHGHGDHRCRRLGPLATREARKKRMARQRRYFSHHRHYNHNGQPQNQNQNQSHPGQVVDPRMGSENCSAVVGAAHANPANWMYWHAMAGGATSMAAAPVTPAEAPAAQSAIARTAIQSQNCHQGRGSSDRRSQGWKSEKNLKFLLQKVLKQSDVGSLGRIVLPKKEAETHLPELDAKDGISIEMEDIGTSRVWNMRYRYWPNNKSRMYLLENTGDFVRANGLQEGDFIVIYSDVKCGKFMIRGVKVRQAGTKSETKKARKSQKNQHGNTAANTAGNGANNGTPSSPQQKMRN